MARKIPAPLSHEAGYLAIIAQQNEEIIALLKRIAPKDEQQTNNGEPRKLTGL